MIKRSHNTNFGNIQENRNLLKQFQKQSCGKCFIRQQSHIPQTNFLYLTEPKQRNGNKMVNRIAPAVIIHAIITFLLFCLACATIPAHAHFVAVGYIITVIVANTGFMLFKSLTKPKMQKLSLKQSAINRAVSDTIQQNRAKSPKQFILKVLFMLLFFRVIKMIFKVKPADLERTIECLQKLGVPYPQETLADIVLLAEMRLRDWKSYLRTLSLIPEMEHSVEEQQALN